MENIWKAVGIFGYLATLLVIGAMAARRMKDMKDYFTAGKQLGFLAVAFSARATGESAWLLLGLTGMGALVGVQAFWVVLGEVLGVTLAWVLMSGRFKRLTDRYDSMTVPDYLESRFADKAQILRLASAIALVIFVTIYVSAQIHATGAAFESFLGWNYYLGAIVGFAVVLVYTVSGGFLAVAWSDVFQGFLMFIGLVLLPIVAVAVAGGMGPILDGLQAQDPTLLSPWGKSNSTLIAVCSTLGFLLIGVGFLGSPQIFVRFLALKSTDEIVKGTTVAFFWTLLADTGAVVIGMAGRHMLVGDGVGVESVLGIGAEGVLPAMVEHVMPAFLVGLYIAVVLSAIMSTVDSLLVLAASALVRDYYQKIRNPGLSDEGLMKVSRNATFGLAGLAFALAMGVSVITGKGSVFWFVIFGWSGIAATFCPTIILSLFWSKMTAKGALGAMVVGFLGVPLFKFVVPAFDGVREAAEALTELPPSFALSFLAGIIISLADKSGQKAVAHAKDDLEFSRGKS